MFYVRCLDREDGPLACWWKPNHRGYTFDLKEAGLYTKEEAKAILAQANFGGRIHEVMVPVEVAKQAARTIVEKSNLVIGRVAIGED